MAGRFKLVFSDLVKSLHQIWLEVIGMLFLVFAAAFGYQAVKEYREYAGPADNSFWIFGAAGLSLVTLSFGIHSLWKARKLR